MPVGAPVAAGANTPSGGALMVNLNWKPGDPINSPVREMVPLDPAHLTVPEMYKLLIGAVIPRPIAFVTTVSPSGQGNLAPFSFFNAVSSNPPCVAISISRKSDGEKKDTLRNIEATGEFVVNTASEWLAEPLAHCGAAYPYGVDEMGVVGLTPLPSFKVQPPRVREAAVHFECTRHAIVELGDGGPGSTVLVIGRIVQAHIHAAAWQNGRVIAAELKPLARLGGFGYALLGETFDLKVPEV